MLQALAGEAISEAKPYSSPVGSGSRFRGKKIGISDDIGRQIGELKRRLNALDTERSETAAGAGTGTFNTVRRTRGKRRGRDYDGISDSRQNRPVPSTVPRARRRVSASMREQAEESAVVQIRIAAAQTKLLTAAAKRMGLSLSAWARLVMLKAEREQRVGGK
jgi:hypothetical protein